MLLAACKSCSCQRLLWPIAFALTRRLRRSKPRVRGRGASDGQVPVEEGLPPHADDLHRGGARFRRRQHLQSELPGGGVYVMYIRTIYSRSIDQSSWIPRRQACLFVERSLLVFLLRLQRRSPSVTFGTRHTLGCCAPKKSHGSLHRRFRSPAGEAVLLFLVMQVFRVLFFVDPVRYVLLLCFSPPCVDLFPLFTAVVPF